MRQFSRTEPKFKTNRRDKRAFTHAVGRTDGRCCLRGHCSVGVHSARPSARRSNGAAAAVPPLRFAARARPPPPPPRRVRVTMLRGTAAEAEGESAKFPGENAKGAQSGIGPRRGDIQRRAPPPPRLYALTLPLLSAVLLIPPARADGLTDGPLPYHHHPTGDPTTDRHSGARTGMSCGGRAGRDRNWRVERRR